MQPVRESERPFRSFARDVKAHVDGALADWLAPRVAEASSLHAEVGAVARACLDLAVRGGKRLRPALTAAAYEAFDGAGGARGIGPALVALELLQAYLLIHDDWMDGDATRRGGPSAHASLGAAFGSAQAGAVAAILAGDLAVAYAQEALLETDVAPAALVAAARELASMQHSVVLGQTLDVRSVSRGSSDVERMHDLKTGSYTVRGPLRLGAALAGADDLARRAIDAFAGPLGIAFQLRDDLLGLFGDPSVTGKPRGSDLRERKKTAVVADLWLDAEWAARLEGAARLDDGAVDRLLGDIERTGARERVEARIVTLEKRALTELAALPVSARGRDLLADAARALTTREL